MKCNTVVRTGQYSSTQKTHCLMAVAFHGIVAVFRFVDFLSDDVKPCNQASYNSGLNMEQQQSKTYLVIDVILD